MTAAKLCPLLFGGAATVVTANTDPDYVAANADDEVAGYAVTLSACHGSACMMWRTMQGKGSKGYCGLAERPPSGEATPDPAGA